MDNQERPNIQVGNIYETKHGHKYIIYDRAGFVGEAFRRLTTYGNSEKETLKDIGSILANYKNKYFGFSASGAFSYMALNEYGESVSGSDPTWNLIV